MHVHKNWDSHGCINPDTTSGLRQSGSSRPFGSSDMDNNQVGQGLCTFLWRKVGLKDLEQLVDVAQRHSVLRQERVHLQQLRGSCSQQHRSRGAVLLHTGRVGLQETLQEPLQGAPRLAEQCLVTTKLPKEDSNLVNVRCISGGSCLQSLLLRSKSKVKLCCVGLVNDMGWWTPHLRVAQGKLRVLQE